MRQSGYVMLLLLPTLIVFTVSISLVQPSVNNKIIRQSQTLVDARQHLIAYSASYLESYKPTGAGPGHLPCPDTDQVSDEYQVQAGLHGDGPNPPCGKRDIAIGKLPRHISHGKHRYAFHLEDKHALWYAVDTRFINNPVNRVVNPDTAGRIRLLKELPAAAVIFIPLEGAPIWTQSQSAVAKRLLQALQGSQGSGVFEESISQYVLITPAALLNAVTQRVALWLHEQYRIPDGIAYAAMRACNIPQRDKMLLLLLSNSPVTECDGSLADVGRAKRLFTDAKLDAVFLRRHWFYRNDWWRFVAVQLDDGCEEKSVDCYATVNVTAGQRPIALRVHPL
ncbi:MAG: hypothetical protein V3U65_19060 [Granulosicoccaceae bacterium]